MPWICLGAVIHDGVQASWEIAVALLLSFDCYLRPFEMDFLTAG